MEEEAVVDQVFHIAEVIPADKFTGVWLREVWDQGGGVLIQRGYLIENGHIATQSYSFYADMRSIEWALAWLKERGVKYISLTTTPIKLGAPQLADSQNCDPIEIRPINIDQHDGATQ